MFIDVNHGPLPRHDFDLCIAGAGPAGLTLALEAVAKGRSVLLLEGGGLDFLPRSQEVYRGRNAGLDYLPCDTSRLRYFGGTSNHWAGWCRPLDDHDFIRWPHIPHSGWPITRQDLAPYAAKAREILEIPPVKRHPNYLQGVAGADLTQIDFEFSPPVRFGSKYRQAVEGSEKLVCALNANVVDIVLRDGSESVSHLEVAGYGGGRYRARARYYVLCLGGIENARALLNANGQRPEGVGNRHGLVGRFFTEHPHFRVAHFVFDHEHPAVAAALKAASLTRTFYAPTPEFMAERQVLNFGLRVEPFATKLRSGEPGLKERIKQLICRSGALTELVTRYREGFDCIRPLFDGAIVVASQQRPNPDSRVRLDEARDKFGKRRVVLDWRLTPQDKRTLRRAAEAVGERMARTGVGRVKVPGWLLDPALHFPGTDEDLVAGCHHMGTTRMAANPREGVVDRDCRVFGSDNLYLAGSSVFTTGGHANPTFTIVQLSLRLAEHLERRLRAEAVVVSG